MRKIPILLAVGLLLWMLEGALSLQSTQTAPKELIVCPSGCPFIHIQEAINAAQPGDTVSIGAGTYHESLLITKEISLKGESAETVRVEASVNGATVLTVQNDPGVTISAMTFSGGHVGILISSSTITLGNIQVLSPPKATGIEAYGFSGEEFVLSGSQILGNAASFDPNEGGTGILLLGSIHARLNGNVISGKMTGVDIGGLVEGELRQNTISMNGTGAAMGAASRVDAEGNQVAKNLVGFQLGDQAIATIAKNEFRENTQWGIALWLPPCVLTSDHDPNRFVGTIQGEDNQIILDSGGDGGLCPFPGEYPWPDGFVASSSQ